MYRTTRMGYAIVGSPHQECSGIFIFCISLFIGFHQGDGTQLKNPYASEHVIRVSFNHKNLDFYYLWFVP